MCGITGIALSDPTCPVEQALLERMTNSLIHRGPDGVGYHRGPGIGLGMRRLSIIDIETGNQPSANEDGTCWVICNGEIYNYLELRGRLEKAGHQFRSQSDTEVIIHLYEEYGEACLEHLRGMFAIAIWDGNRQQLLLARDRLGIKPLYYSYASGQRLVFGSEIKAILASGQINREVDAYSVKNLLLFGFVLSPGTMFPAVNRLAPGHYLVYRLGRLSTRQYWELNFPGSGEHDPRTADEWSEQLREKLLEVVRIHLRSDVPVGAWLSAGLDSSTIVALMHQVCRRSLKTYSLGFSDNPDFDELHQKPTLNTFAGYQISNQRVICDKDHFDLYPKTLYHLEDPTTSGVHVLQMMLAAAASRDHKVVLTGEGADEVFGGYPWYRLDKLSRPFSILPLPLRRVLLLLGPLIPRWSAWASQIFLAPREIALDRYARMIGVYSGAMVADLLSPELLDAANADNERAPPFRLPDAINDWPPFSRLQFIETKTRMVDLIVHGLDRASMAHSVEARVPFLDHELVELCVRIPPSLKMKGLREKYILRQSMAKVLPREILQRKKRGLAAPSSAWLAGRLPPFAEAMLSEESVREKGYFNASRVVALLQQHRSGAADRGRLLMGILGVQLWDDMFVRQRVPAEATARPPAALI
jgi:asparagine synthase (glutamine-hydrolysing)